MRTPNIQGELPDLTAELVASHVDTPWLRDMPASASLVDGTLLLPDLARLVQRLAEDLETMARPLLQPDDLADALRARIQHWLDGFDTLRGERLSRAQLQSLTRGQRTNGDESLHLLVMDLHHALNQLASTVSSEEIDGAHVWQLQSADRARVVAFMRGPNRTAPLKFDHPRLDSAATRDEHHRYLLVKLAAALAHHLAVFRQQSSQAIDLHRSELEQLLPHPV